MLYLIASDKADFGTSGGFTSNGCGEHSPRKYSMVAAGLCEIVMTAMFLIVIMGSTDRRSPVGFAPLVIGLCMTLTDLISIPVTNTSVNPTCSTGVALYAGSWTIEHRWLFWIAPIIGAALGALAYRSFADER